MGSKEQACESIDGVEKNVEGEYSRLMLIIGLS